MLWSNSPMFPTVLLRLSDMLLKSLCVLKNPTGDTNFQNTNKPLLPLWELIPVATVSVKIPGLLKLELTAFEYPDQSCSFCSHFHLHSLR